VTNVRKVGKITLKHENHYCAYDKHQVKNRSELNIFSNRRFWPLFVRAAEVSSYCILDKA